MIDPIVIYSLMLMSFALVHAGARIAGIYREHEVPWTGVRVDDKITVYASLIIPVLVIIGIGIALML